MRLSAKKNVVQFLGLLSCGFVVSFAVLIVIGEVLIEWSGPPVITCGSSIKSGGGDICGSASGNNGVTVSAHRNGRMDPEDQLGETDTSETNGVNDFCFPTDGLSPGEFVEIRAEDDQGNVTFHLVDIIDCP